MKIEKIIHSGEQISKSQMVELCGGAGAMDNVNKAVITCSCGGSGDNTNKGLWCSCEGSIQEPPKPQPSPKPSPSDPGNPKPNPGVGTTILG